MHRTIFFVLFCLYGASTDLPRRLPRASTCFWSFYLPRYSRKEIMRDRIITAITSCGDIDNDFLVQQ